MADSHATSNRPLVHDKTGLLIEVYQTSQASGGREKITRHAGVYVDTHLWRERRDPKLNRWHCIWRAVHIVDLAFKLGVNLAECEHLSYLDLFVPGIVEGLFVEAVHGMIDQDDEAPAIARFLTERDLESTKIDPDGIRIRVLMPDYTTSFARANKPPVWQVSLCEGLIGKVQCLLGTIAESGFYPNRDPNEGDPEPVDPGDPGEQTEPVEQGALIRRIPIDQAAEQAAAEPEEYDTAADDTAFSALCSLDTDFWTAIGGQLDKL